MASRRPFAPSLAAGLVLAAVVLLGAGCVQFQEVSLYDGIAQPPPPERPRLIKLAVSPVIYDDQNDDTVWFEEEMGCTQGEITDEVVFEGRRAVSVDWNREGCEWAGLGFGWDGWAGKDISPIIPYAAIQMHVRAKEGRMYGLPIVLTFEDYSGGMGFAYTGNRYFERAFIDEEWQTVTVPLSAFDYDIENLDKTNVKQLMFELQGSGSVYIDDMQLIFYEEPPLEPWITVELRPDPTALPIQLFADDFINDDGWGLISDGCQSIETTSDDPSQGETALRLQWDVTPQQCYEGAMGISWDKWYPIDMTSVADDAAIQFDARLPSGTAPQLPVRVALEDYNRRASQIILDGRYTASGRFTSSWQTVTIPFSELRGGGRELAAAPATVGNLPAFSDGADLSNLKQLVFFLDESGEVLIDNIRLVRAE